jgi:tetratricopeptide (TPR) repeat protein
MSVAQDNLKSEQAQQLEFLLTVLQSINDSSADPDVVYPLLQQNLALLNDGMIEVLKDWATAEFAEVDRDSQKSIAADIVDFDIWLNQFPRGDKIVKVELSICCYELASQIFSSCEDPKNWLIIQNNFVFAYFHRIKGDESENLEKSISLGEAALDIATKKDFPIDRARLQINLANTYRKRITGNKSENLNQAIKYYHAALAIFTAESFPLEWIAIQLNLALLSINQLRNYEVATEHLQAAYEQLSEHHSDTNFLAKTMFELARCFHKTGALSQSKIYFKDSIRLYQRLEQPAQVAAVNSELGNLEMQMGQIDDARIHLQTALDFYQTANDLDFPEETRRDRIESIQDLQKYLPVSSEKIAS